MLWNNGMQNMGFKINGSWEVELQRQHENAPLDLQVFLDRPLSNADFKPRQP